MSDAQQLAVFGAAGSAAFASLGFMVRALVLDKIKALEASATKQGRRLGRLGERLAVLEARLGIARAMTDPGGVPVVSDER